MAIGLHIKKAQEKKQAKTNGLTLLEQAKLTAKARKSSFIPSEEEIELVQAWVDDEISLTQLSIVACSGAVNQQAYTLIARTLKYILQGANTQQKFRQAK